MTFTPLQLAMKIYADMPHTASVFELEEAVDAQLSAKSDEERSEIKRYIVLLSLPAPDSSPTTGPQRKHFSKGDILKERYRLQNQRENVGAMGEIWEACDLCDHNKPVILKTIRPDRTYPDTIYRFARECFALSQLRSPAIVHYYDYFTDGATGRACLVMERINGSPITTANKGCASVRDIVQQIIWICDGLEIAHSCGIVHRDLKPENILIGLDGHPCIIDFGLVHIMYDLSDRLGPATDISEFGGSYRYASPEQAKSLSLASFPADVYSLGVILFELLAGDLPYKGSVPNRQNLIDRLDRKTPADSLPPRLIGGQRPDKLLKDILKKALALKPGDRYRWAADFGDDLRVWLNRHARGNRHPLIERRLSPGTRFERRRLVRRLSLATAVSVGFAILGVYLWIARTALQIETARSAASLSVMSDLLNEIAPFESTRYMPPEVARAVLDHVLPLLTQHERELGNASYRLLLAAAGAQLALGDPEAAEALYRRITSRPQSAFSNEPWVYVDAMRGRGIALTNLDRRQEATLVLNDALALARQEDPTKHPFAVAGCLESRATLFLDCGNDVEADEDLDEALQRYEGSAREAEIGRMHVLSLIGRLLSMEGANDDASLLFHSAASQCASLFGANSLETLRCRHAALVVDIERAIAHRLPPECLIETAADCASQFTAILGKESDNTAISVHALCRILTSDGRTSESRDRVNDILAAREAAGKPHTMTYARLLKARAHAYVIDNSTKSIPDYFEARGIIETQLGSTSDEYCEILGNIAIAYNRAREYANAISSSRVALKHEEDAHFPNPQRLRTESLYLALSLHGNDPGCAEAISRLRALAPPPESSEEDIAAMDSTSKMAQYWLPIVIQAAKARERSSAPASQGAGGQP